MATCPSGAGAQARTNASRVIDVDAEDIEALSAIIATDC